MLADQELELLIARCRAVPRTKSRYIATDFVSALLDTVIDYQIRNPAVVRAIEHFERKRWNEVRTFDDLKACLARFPETKEGDTELALYLWGYRLWTRAAQLRGLVRFFDGEGIRTIEALKDWADRSTFEDFRGRVHGLGPVVYQWLVMRLGRQTVKPDVHILRFVRGAIGRPVSEHEAVDGLERAASRLGVPANELDWSIWEYQRDTSA